jgi:hypothetical protein
VVSPKFLKEVPPQIDFMGKNYPIGNNHDLQQIVLEYIIKIQLDKIKEIEYQVLLLFLKTNVFKN